MCLNPHRGSVHFVPIGTMRSPRCSSPLYIVAAGTYPTSEVSSEARNVVGLALIASHNRPVKRHLLPLPFHFKHTLPIGRTGGLSNTFRSYIMCRQISDSWSFGIFLDKFIPNYRGVFDTNAYATLINVRRGKDLGFKPGQGDDWNKKHREWHLQSRVSSIPLAYLRTISATYTTVLPSSSLGI